MNGSFRGWPIVGCAALGLAAWVAATLLLDSGENGVASATRATARVAFVFFLLSHAAPGLVRLGSASWTRWLDDRRQALFVAFAACHLIHFGMIVRLAVVTDGASIGRRIDPTHVLGGVTYLFILMIAFGYVLGRLSASVSVTWRRIETFGTFYVWASFMLAAIGKSLEAPAYLPFVALLVASAIFRARAALSPAADRGAAAGRR